MASHSDRRTTGGAYLERLSDAVRRRQNLPTLAKVLLINANASAADVIGAHLRLMYGYNIAISGAATLGTSLDLLLAGKPDAVFLDDRIPPNETALGMIPILRRCAFTGPIIVTCAGADLARDRLLYAAGVADVIERDAIGTVRLAETLVRIHRAAPVIITAPDESVLETVS